MLATVLMLLTLPVDPPKTHWAFVSPERSQIPSPKRQDWVRNPIDGFLLRDLEVVQLEPAEEASRFTLIRRLSFDLTGLPPTPEEVEAFVRDNRADAYERLADRLLASPQYGERWARAWLDLARYSESDGFKSDKTRPNSWRYRDWVVSALNSNLPFDRFVMLQIAGDEIAPDDPAAFIATGFNRNFPFEDNSMVPGLNHQLMLDDMTDTTASVFLGLTVACARCHNHKYDPISQKEYYGLQAFFAASTTKDDRLLADPFATAVYSFVSKAHAEKVADGKQELAGIERPYVATLLKDKLAKMPADLRQAFQTEPIKRSAFQEDLLVKNSKLMAVDAKALKAMMPAGDRQKWDATLARMQTLAKESPRVLPAASGMTDTGPQAPTIHLLRKGTFGKPLDAVGPGFLSALPNAGQATQVPSETKRTTGRRLALAKWLASPQNPLTARVMVNRLWQGHFGRGLVATPSDFGTQGARPSNPELLDWLATEFVASGWDMKAMHRLMVTSSAYRQSSTPSAKAREDDPDNTYLSRMPRKRLEGEAVRDAMLATSGQLNPAIGGPSVFPDLPPGVETRGGWTRSEKASDRNRRSLYVFSRRNLKYPLFDAFDAPDSNLTCPERNISVNSPQALMLLNSELVIETAGALARKVQKDVSTGDSEALVRKAYQVALGREPDLIEKERAIGFLKEGGTLAEFCHAVINLNEFVFVD